MSFMIVTPLYYLCYSNITFSLEHHKYYKPSSNLKVTAPVVFLDDKYFLYLGQHYYLHVL